MSILMSMNILSQTDPRTSWLPIVLLLVIGILFAAGNIFISLILGPKSSNPGKGIAYESGMVPVGDTKRRFNVRFYLVAMIFLVFDVEIVFFYPWATLFPDAVIRNLPNTGLLLAEMLVFVAILLVAYFYAWGKGVFRWD
jgi:NADH-quinone oxidoreductase subunit A